MPTFEHISKVIKATRKKMTCTNPKTIFIRASHPIDFNSWEEHEQHKYNKAKFAYNKGYYEIKVPCGHCLGCKLDHANEWATRCTIEAKQWDKCCMVTLTYNNKNLPRTKNGKPTLYKKDIQDFLKRLRKKYQNDETLKEWINPKTGKKQRPIRYFYCGEYGPTNGRPHYHMIIFNWKPKELEFYKYNKHSDEIYKCKELYNGNGKGLWGKGFCTVEDMNYNTACYVARYCTKKAGLNSKSFKIPLKTPKIDNKGIHTQYKKSTYKPQEMYINMSTGVGIGLNYWLENMEFLKKWRYIELKINDEIKRKPLPRYFKKQWNKECWQTYEKAKYEDFKKAEENKKIIIKLDNFDNSLTDEQKWKLHLEKIKEKLEKRCKYSGILKREFEDDKEQRLDCVSLASLRYGSAFGELSKEKKESTERWTRILEHWKRENEFLEQNIINF